MPAAWTTPRNWTAGELVTAAIGNSAWRDNFMYLKDSPVFDGNVTVTGTIAGAAMTLSSTLGVTGATTLSSTVATGALTVTGAATVSTTLNVTGATMLSSTASVQGAMLVTGFARLKAGLSTDDTDPGATNLRVGGTSALVGNVTYTTSLKSITALATPSALTATQATAFASTVSGAAIMGFGTTNDVALMNRAGTVVLGIGPNTTTVNMTGLLSVTGFGGHSFSAAGTGYNNLTLTNTTSGTGNGVYLDMNAGTAEGTIYTLSQGYSSGTYDQASSLVVRSHAAGGLSLASTNASGVIRFYTGGTTENMRIHANGRVTIGAATVIASARQTVAFLSTDNGMTIENQDNQSGGTFMIFTSAQTINGVISRVAATAAVTYGTTSDQRLKTDRGLASNIARLRALPIHDFDWKSDGTTDRGVFAQEAYSLYPLAVTKGTDELNDNGQLSKPWSVSYASFVPDLIVGWQQQDKEITQLAARIAALESQDN